MNSQHFHGIPELASDTKYLENIEETGRYWAFTVTFLISSVAIQVIPLTPILKALIEIARLGFLTSKAATSNTLIEALGPSKRTRMRNYEF